MLPNAHYMDLQSEIQWSMRSVLMDWLIQVHHRFALLPETLFLCVNYIDRFLSCKIVSLGKLQLVGATAIFVAAKYEEINCPSVQEIVYMVDGGYSVDEILKAERFMLTMLQFELGWPGPMSFLRRISKADDYDLETRTLAKYFLEVTIMDERFVGSPPSYVAAGAHCFARLMLKKGDWVRFSSNASQAPDVDRARLEVFWRCDSRDSRRDAVAGRVRRAGDVPAGDRTCARQPRRARLRCGRAAFPVPAVLRAIDARATRYACHGLHRRWPCCCSCRIVFARRRWPASALVMVKETGIVVPLVFAAWLF